MRARTVLAALAAFAVLSSASPFASAVVPGTINYQGYLTNAAGQPITGVVSMSFQLSNAPSGCCAYWAETKAVSVQNGIYNVVLGTTTPISTLDFSIPYYLGVMVGGEELAPRTLLTSAPYAIRALKAEGVTDGAITGSAIQNQSVPLTKLSNVGCFDGDVPRYDGSEWTCAGQFSGTVSSPPANDSVLTYHSSLGGANWRQPTLTCNIVSASQTFAHLQTGYVNATCPGGTKMTGGGAKDGNKYAVSVTYGIDGTSCFFSNDSGSNKTVACTAVCCNAGF